jgi:hypothetical protein
MNLESVFINDELVIGEECYYDHDTYTYNGTNEDGTYLISKKTKDNELTKTISKRPTNPKLPLGLYFKNKRTGYFAELTSYTHMLGKMYYKLTIYEDVFKGYVYESLDEIKKDWELLIENPFLDEEVLTERIDELNMELNGYETQIREIEMHSIDPIKKKREELYKFCKHDWYKYDEEEVSKNYYEQQCECQICGKVTYSRYNRWN